MSLQLPPLCLLTLMVNMSSWIHGLLMFVRVATQSKERRLSSSIWMALHAAFTLTSSFALVIRYSTNVSWPRLQPFIMHFINIG